MDDTWKEIGQELGIFVPPSPWQCNIYVAYGGKVVDNGSILTPSDVANIPTVTVYKNGKNLIGLYFLALVEMGNKKKECFNHWLAGNIPSKALYDGKVENYTTTQYVPPHEWHRYVFLLFQQEEERVFTEMPMNSFNLSNFCRENYLYQLVAGTYFLIDNSENSTVNVHIK